LTLECNVLPTIVEPTVTDNCDANVSLSFALETLPGDCANERTEVYRWTAIDACGNEAVRTLTIHFVDTTAPEIFGVPQDLTLECDQEIPMVFPTALDNCDDDVVISLTATTVQNDCGYTLTRTWTATDACGNASSKTQNITVVDTTNPEAIFVPGSVTIECDQDIPSEEPIFIDNCDDDLEIVAASSISNVSECGYTINRSWTAIDDCGNATTVTQTIVVVDTTAPVLVDVPGNETVDCTMIPQPAEVTAIDNCDENPAVAFSESISTGCPYTITRTWVATDACGNMSTATQVITVVDTEAPILVGVPDNITDECGSLPAVVEVTAVDNCDTDVPVMFSQEVIGEVCPLTVIRTWTAIDACGNSVSASQTIVINDETAPEFVQTPDSEITVECDAVPMASADDVQVADNCDLNPSVDFEEVLADLDPAIGCGYRLIRTWTAKDLCFNESSFVQIVNVIDTQAPTLVGVPQNATVECDNVPSPAQVTAFDNCFEGDITVTLSEQIELLDCGYTLTRTWSASDDCGNTAIESQVLTVVDTQAPTVVSTPADVTIECDQPMPTEMPVFTDNCDDDLEITMSMGSVPLACGVQIIRSWKATDNCGNEVTTSQTIFVIDTTNPELIGVPQNAEVSCDNIPAVPIVTAIDNCDDEPMVQFNEVINSGSCPYTIERTWTATDDCGNSVSQTQIITVIDEEAPVLIGVPENVTVDCNTIPAIAMVTAIDNCSDDLVVDFIQSIQPLEDCGYKIIRTWSVADDCNNQASATQLITVIDTEAPIVVSQPENLSLSCEDEIPFVAPVFSDDCDEQLEVGFETFTTPGDCPQNVIITRIWTAVDDCGNSTSVTQTIEVNDTSEPVLVGVPADVTVECDAIPSPATVTAIDNCDPNVNVILSESMEPLDCGFALTRTWSATDACGNQVVDSQVITVIDTTDPVAIFVPGPITIECDQDIPSAEPIFTDNCDDDLTITAASSIAPLDCGFEIQRSWTATDDCGNATTVSQIITVVDTTDPVLIGVPANLTAECDAIPAVAEVSAEDNCDEAPQVSFSETSSGDGCPLIITRTWTATDNCGNSTTATQVITVVDTTDPVLIGVPQNQTVDCNAIPAPAMVTAEDNCSDNLEVFFDENVEELECGAVITRTWTVSDACGNTTTADQVITVVDTTNPVLVGVPQDATVECDQVPAPAQVTATDDCSDDLIVGFSEQIVPAECGYVLVRTWTVTDDCGNTASASQTLTVVDTTAPAFVNPPADITVECDAIPGQINPVVQDNCDPMPMVNAVDVVETLDCGSIITRTYTVTDNCGNSAEHVQIITVTDTTNPVLVGIPANLEIDCDAVIPAPAQVTATDNCDSAPSVSLVESVVQLSCGSQIVRTWTAVDHCGNTTSAQQTITLVDVTPPVFDTVLEDITVDCEDLTIAPTVTATDACSSVEIAFTESIIDEGCPYTIERKWVATDGCGNSSELIQLVTVIDEEAPVFEDFPFFISLACDEVADYLPEAFDNCSAEVTVEIVQELTFSGGCLGVLSRTYRAVDLCGNETFAEQLIQQVDNVAPSLFNVPESVTIECGEDIPAIADDVFATDNCTDVTITFTEVQTNEFCPYEIIRTWTAVDQCGNVTEGVQVITVTVETDHNNLTLITYPNPMDERFTVEFTVPRDAEIVARVYDMMGREVLNVFDGHADARRFYQLGFENLDWKAGAYILMMTVDGKVHHHRMIVTQSR